MRAALAGRVQLDRRRSRTFHRDFLYLGLPARGGGVVRLALDLGAVDARVAALRRELWLAGGFALVLSFALAFVLSALAVRPMRELRRVVGSLARGDLDQRLAWRSDDELGRIAAGVNRLADQLRGLLA